MNEQIKELADQALQLVADEHTKGDTSRLNTDSYQVKDLINEKFAELIVKECVTKVAEWDMGIDHPVGATDNTSQVARDIVAEIKEHFGIKEE